MRTLILIFVATGWLAAAETGPGKTYQTYAALVHKCVSLKELFPYFDDARRKELSTLEKDDREMMLTMLRSLAPTEVKVTSEKVQGDRATLVALGKINGRLADGQVTMVKQQGTWRLAGESWQARK
ncbi:MAG: hypothetical protein AMXMBFR33_35330 [Candidatus Xenobia bacterium]